MRSILLLTAIMILIPLQTSALREYKIIETKTGNEVKIEEMAEKSQNFDIMFFGEFHDDSLVHQLQFEYLSYLYQKNDDIAVSMEMFERDVQKYIDQFLSGDIDEEKFLDNSRPWKDYKDFYKPLVDLAKENDSHVIAANIPRKYAAMYARSGMAAIKKLPEKERNYIANEMILRDDDYKDKFFATMAGNPGKIKKMSLNEKNTLWLYYGAQSIKDETMAESILKYYNNNDDDLIVHFNGDFHSNSYLGTAQKVIQRNDDLKVGVITPEYYDEEIDFGKKDKNKGDFIIYLEEKPQKKMPQGMPNMHLGENYVDMHNIEIKIDPERSFLTGRDSILFKNPIIHKSTVQMLNSLKIKNIKCYEGDVDYEIKKLDDNYNKIIFTNKSFDKQKYGESGIIEANNILIEYEGEVYNEPSETNLTERHSRSAGIISGKDGEGIYLPPGAYYPKAEKDIADFYLQINIPEEYTIITSGDVRERTVAGSKQYAVKTPFKLDGVILVGGKYHKTSKMHDDVEFNVYTFGKSRFTENYLEASIEHYDMYSELFGGYPFGSYSIVENFFATGFGMPGYTLLSGKLLQMPWVTLSPGSLAHEFVHNWWGNSVFVDYERGNWCEALTAFSTNYYYNILNQEPEEAKDWRKKALIAIDALPEDKNYPVSKFEYQKDKFDAVIGYEKGAFIFHEIYKIMGKDAFFAALKELAEKYRGKRALWYHLTRTFSSRAKKDSIDHSIRDIFNQWLYSKDIPEFTLDDVEVDDGEYTIKLNQTGDFKTKVPVVFKNGENVKKQYFFIDKKENELKFKPGFEAEKIEVDPDYEVLRKLYEWEKPYSFNRTLGRENTLVILPSKKSKDYKAAKQFMMMMNRSGYNFNSVSADEMDKDLIEEHSLLLLGNVKNNEVLRETAKNLDLNIKLEETRIEVDDGEKEFPSNEHLMLMNIDHPENKDHLCSVIYYDSANGADELARFFHYQSYSMVIIKRGSRGRPAYSREIYPSGYDKSTMRWEK